VHSGVYSFAIEGLFTSQIPKLESYGGNFFDIHRGDTLLKLVLHKKLELTGLRQYLGELTTSILLFLRHIRSVSVIDGDVERTLELREGVRDNISPGISRFVLLDGSEKHIVYEKSIDVPDGYERSEKAAGSTTKISFADTLDSGRIYVTLPTRIESNLPFSLSADYDPGTNRETLQDSDWNIFLFKAQAEFVVEVVVALLAKEARSAWYLIPRAHETETKNQWLANQLVIMRTYIHEQLMERAILTVNDRKCRLRELCFIEEDLEDYLHAGDAERIFPLRVEVPHDARDDRGYRLVIEDFGAGKVDLDKAFTLFDLASTSDRTVKWCSALVAVALKEKRGDLLTKHACFIVRGGRTHLQLRDVASDWLTLADAETPLGRLNLVKQIDGAYADLPNWLELERVLLLTYNYHQTITPTENLSALARRTMPVYLTNSELIEVRKLLEYVHDPVVSLKLGKVIELDAFEYSKNGKKIIRRALANECYLPKAIAKDKNGAWAMAADGVPGIIWAAPKYADALRSARGKNKPGAVEKGPLRFLLSLGCEIAPRLLPRTLKLERAELPTDLLLRIQTSDFSVRNDFVSPDLEIVLSKCLQKKAELVVRSRPLFESLNQSWNRLYASKTFMTIEWEEKRKKFSAVPTASWLAMLSSRAWLLNEKKKAALPNTLVIGTEINRAIYAGNPERLALGITLDIADSGLPKALGMTVESDLRALTSQLRILKGSEKSTWGKRGVLLLKALAVRCDRPRSGVALDGMPQTDFRGLLERERLLYLPRYDTWAAPSEVLKGSDILGGRRMFVPSKPQYVNLWRYLEIRSVSIADCIAVVTEIADSKEYTAEVESTLLEIFSYLNQNIDAADDYDRRSMSRMPLWNGDKFYKTGPFFVTSDPAMSAALSPHIKIWKPPFDAMGKPKLLSALNVSIVGEENITVVGCGTINQVPTAAMERFQRAIDILKDRLMREESATYKGVNWLALESASLYVSEMLCLRAEIRLTKDEIISETVPVAAYCDVMGNGVTFYYRDLDAIGNDVDGGRVVASLFESRHRSNAATLWYWAWGKAEAGNNAAPLTLHSAEQEAKEEDGPTLEELVKASFDGKKKKPSWHSPAKPHTNPVSKPEPIYQRLKDFSDVITTKVSIVNKGENNGGPQPSSPGRGIKSDVGGGSRYTGGGTGQSTPKAPVRLAAYSGQEQEDAGFAVLAHIFNGGGDEAVRAAVLDFRKERGIGSDVIVQLENVRSWVELKCSAGDPPSTVSFTLNEYLRAQEQGAKFYLAVVSGVAEGYETVVRLYRNPLKGLKWVPSSSIVFSDLYTSERIECVIQSSTDAKP
jgi:hypothetical protein